MRLIQYILLVCSVLLLPDCARQNKPEKIALIRYPKPFYQRGVGGSCAYYGIKTERFTLINNEHGTWLLYDKLIDPDQVNNLVGLDEYTFIQIDLEKQLQQLLENVPCKDISKYWLAEFPEDDAEELNNNE